MTMITQIRKRYEQYFFFFFCLTTNKLQTCLFNTTLILLGGQEFLCKHSEEKGVQTGNWDQNSKDRKGCTCEGSWIQEKKDGSKHASA